MTNGTVTQNFTIHPPYQSNSFELLKLLANRGLGIALLPTMGDFTPNNGLIRSLPDWQGVTVPIMIVTATRLLPVKVRCMIDFLVEKVEQPK